MTLSIKEIKELENHLVNTRHSHRVEVQQDDQTYYDDTFSLPLIKDASYIVRTGAPARLINGITEQIVTDNPQAFTKPRENTNIANASSVNVAKEFNRQLQILNKQNPNPFKESIKNKLVRGDNYIYVIHNESLVNYKGDWHKDMPDAVPVKYIVFDPMIVFFDPDEGEENGIPNRVIISFKRSAGELHQRYPHWKPKNGMERGKWGAEPIPFFMYWDNKIRYFEADDSALLTDDEGKLANGEGIQKNPYGFVPLVHSYSGFGKDSVDKDPASLAVSRIRMIKDMYREDCTMRSDFSFIIHKFAHKHYDLINKSGTKLSPDLFNNYDAGAGKWNVVDIPPGADIEVRETLLPDAQVFQYYNIIRGDLAMEDLPILRGVPVSSSGRQDDIARNTGMKLYSSVINNTAREWATALDMGAKVSEKMMMLPVGIKEGDFENYTDTRVELRSIDPIEAERKSLSGRAQVQAGQLSLKTNFIKFQNMTDGEADDEIDQMMAEQYILQNPDIAMFIGAKVAEKSGLADEFAAWKEQRQQEEGKFQLGRPIGSKGGEPRTENIQSARGAEEADITKRAGPIRRPPTQ